MDPTRRRIEVYIICICLMAVVLASYWHAFDNGFVYDDSGYILYNSPIHHGPTAKALVWAFTTFHAGNYHPITWVSHMLDCGSYGAKPKGHHLTSVLLHLANTFLLFTLLLAMTDRPWRSAFVAAMFAAHPLHVESVAWVSERKDLLSAFFGLLAILAYVAYVHKPGVGRYAAMAALLALGLLTKPMLVTLPVVLLLLDYWPLVRKQGIGNSEHEKAYCRSTAFLVFEKLPLFAVSAAAAVVAVMAQRASSAVAPGGALPLAVRLDNAAVAYITYIRKMFWPTDLAAFYPHPVDGLPWWQVAGSVMALVCITVLVLRARTRRYLAVGWLWYLVTLVPVIGIVQVGGQAMADRYTYIPLIGLFIMLAWGVPELLQGRRWLAVTAAAALLSTVGCVALTRRQVTYWKDDLALFTHATRVTRNNWVAQNQLACTYIEHKQWRLALSHAREAARIQSYNPNSHVVLAIAFLHLNRLDESIEELNLAISQDPGLGIAHAFLARAYEMQGKDELAREEAHRALRTDPDNAVALDVLRKTRK